MPEGSLEAPQRHPLQWRSQEFYDAEKLDAELRRVFEICHGCRRCFNLCDSFPRLFDLIDGSESGELDSVASADFKPVLDACTLCDMCFMSKCPYVPPHEFDLDFPHLMLRWRAVERRDGVAPSWTARQLTETDRNGRAAAVVAPLANWAARRGNALTRPILEKVAHVHRDAELPRFHGRPFHKQAAATSLAANPDGPAFGREAVLYATCFANYNNPDIGLAARAVLARNGVAVTVDYPECCGMPQWEQGDLERVAAKAVTVARALRPHVDAGRAIIALTPSCALMLKSEWPLLLPENDDVKALAAATADISDYIVTVTRDGLAPGLQALPGPVSLHIACHARAQNRGRKAEEMLRLIPDLDLTVVERCSGHGGSWGIMQETFEVGMKVGRATFRQMHAQGKPRYIVSECPLAGLQIAQGLEVLEADAAARPETIAHPVLLLARAWGLMTAP